MTTREESIDGKLRNARVHLDRALMDGRLLRALCKILEKKRLTRVMTPSMKQWWEDAKAEEREWRRFRREQRRSLRQALA